MASDIDTGDKVFHGPTGETWIVARVDGTHLYWAGWPPGRAALADCTLVHKATDGERLEWLKTLARSGHHTSAWAADRLKEAHHAQ